MGYTILLRKLMPFQDIPVLGNILNLGDIIYAVCVAFVITFVVVKIRNAFKIDIRTTDLNSPSGEVSRIIQKCYSLFPNEIIQFRGQTFKRGMNIKVTTTSRKTFEGRLIGTNNENIICVLTKNHIAADILDNIEDISVIETE